MRIVPAAACAAPDLRSQAEPLDLLSIAVAQRVARLDFPLVMLAPLISESLALACLLADPVSFANSVADASALPSHLESVAEVEIAAEQLEPARLVLGPAPEPEPALALGPAAVIVADARTSAARPADSGLSSQGKGPVAAVDAVAGAAAAVIACQVRHF